MASEKKVTIASKADPLQAEMLRKRAARTGKNQTNVLPEGLQDGDELARFRAQVAELQLENESLWDKKPRVEYLKSARMPPTLQEHDALHRAAFEWHTTMELLLRAEADKYLTDPTPELPRSESVT